MGMDIHMSIINGDHYLQKEIFEGRNSEWFNNLMDRGNDPEYEYLPTHSGRPEECPEDIKDNYKLPAKEGYFGFNYITVEDFYSARYNRKTGGLNPKYIPRARKAPHQTTLDNILT